MNILKKIKNIIDYIFYGLKASNDVMLSQNVYQDSISSSINQVITRNNLGEDLLKGEITQEVEELRYSDYKVSNESKKYKYIGNGEAIKTISNKKTNKYSFSQENKIICEGVTDEMKRLNSYGTERYTLSILYKDVPKFRLETYCNMIDVDINEQCDIKLHFSKYPNQYVITSKAFINELNKYYSDKQYFILNNEICQNIESIMFTTYKAINEDDLISYKLNNLVCYDIIDTKHEFILFFHVKSYARENMIEKFYSQTMDKKYKNKKQKNTESYSIKDNSSFHCDICGKEINLYDAQITEQTLGKKLCNSCLEKEILKNT